MSSAKRDPDPNKILHERLDARKVPAWVDSKENQCHHCSDKLKLRKRHHCRLCGQEFCSLCTWKYHLPERFARKAKQGPGRVCFGCRDDVLASHRIYDQSVELPRPRLIARIRGGRLYIFPPVWVDESEYSVCKQCHVPRGRHPYFCRICGEMFCTDCTFKDMVPDAFRQKLYKQGPVRICFECRWRITGGAILVDERDAKPTEQEVFRAARPSPKLKQSRTASNEQLFNAILHGSREELEQILKSPTIDVNAFDVQNMTPLMHCARKGMVEKMRALVSACSDSLIIDHRNKKGMSAFMYAANEGHRDVVSILLSQPRCDVNLSSLAGYTALMFAANCGHSKMVSRLLGADLIDYNYRNKRGDTALVLAAAHGHSKVVDELLKVHRIDLDGENVAGKTAVDVASDNGHESCRAAIHKASVARKQTNFKKLFRIHLCIPDAEAHTLAAKFIQADIQTDLENLNVEHIQEFGVSAELQEKLKQLMLASHNRRRERMEGVPISRRISALDLEALPGPGKRPSVGSLGSVSRQTAPPPGAANDYNNAHATDRRPPRARTLMRSAATAYEPFGGAKSQTRFVSSSIASSTPSFLSQDFSSQGSHSLSFLTDSSIRARRALSDPSPGNDCCESRDCEYERFLSEITKDGFVSIDNYRKLLHKYARVDTTMHSNALAALRLRPRTFDQMIVKGRDTAVAVFHAEPDGGDGQALKIMAEGGFVSRVGSLPDLPMPEIHNCTNEVIAFRIGSRSSSQITDNADETKEEAESTSLSFKEGEIIGPLARRPLKCSGTGRGPGGKSGSIRVSLSAFVGCSVYYLTNVELSPGDVYRIGQNDVELRHLFSEGKGSALLFRQARTLLGLVTTT